MKSFVSCVGSILSRHLLWSCSHPDAAEPWQSPYHYEVQEVRGWDQGGQGQQEDAPDTAAPFQVGDPHPDEFSGVGLRIEAKRGKGNGWS